MKLTRYSDYSLRVLMYLGVRGEGLATISEIAEAYGISRNHVMKVVFDLGRIGYIETVRGKRGGIRLRRAPEEINVGELVRRTETSLELVECFGSDNTCCLAPVCVLRGALDEALRAFLEVLDRYTLADLIAPRRQLADQLKTISFA
ncbi:Rrf2 family transcriptional regulator [Spiribacter halobius]|nr:Rrf2 family transcriptional regulator [Spiribacter halobius]UEX79715.1 Rrf2 family transcriptional regulator [Spiribacter halobius]